MLSRLTKKLNLTEQQRSEVAQVFDETQRRFENLRDQHGAEIDGILEGGKDRIKEHLSPDQQQEFERIVERMRARWQKGRGPKGPPPPPFEPG
jgi:DNA-binding MarR family transcriptional regulator